MLYGVGTHHKWISSSTLVMAELLYLRIFAIAEMAFSVGFTFSGSRLCGALIISIKRGILCAHGTANCSPAN